MAGCKSSALGLLGRREYSRYMLQEKLLQKKFSPEVVEETLNDLETTGWLSDARFTECYIRYRAGQGYGPIKIRFELLQKKGISQSIVEQAFVETEVVWSEVLQNSIKRISRSDEIPLEIDESLEINSAEEMTSVEKMNEKKRYLKQKSKAMNTLLRRGFNSENIRKCIRAVEGECK
ncbi:MAG: regulatory protein RecX [Pseudomonadota bacterium]